MIDMLLWIVWTLCAFALVPLAMVAVPAPTAPKQSLRERFIAFDDKLASFGVPPLTQWWRDGIGEWLDAYEAGRILELVACCGRGAAKSTALYKLALFFTLFGDFTIPPGEIHYAIVLSRLKEEAAKGIAIISRWLTLLRVGHRLAGDVIELEDLPRGIRVAAATVAAVSGWRAFAAFKDERSKFVQSGIEERDAEEIDTSAGAMTATHWNAVDASFGSAWVALGGFYESVMGGTNESRIVLGPAPTWIAAPHIKESDLRRKERDPKRFAYEYACEFRKGGSAALPVDELEACIRDLAPESTWIHGQEIVIDSQGGRHDNFVIARLGYVLEQTDEPEFLRRDIVDERTGAVLMPRAYEIRDEQGHRIKNPKWHPPKSRLYLAEMISFTGEETRQLTTHDICDRIETMAHAHGIARVHGDQYGAWSWSSDLSKRGLLFEEHAWTAPSKSEAVLRLRQLIRERDLVINPALGTEARELIREATTFEEKISPSGIMTFGARGASKDDRVMVLLLASRCDAEGRLHGSPIATWGGKHVIHDNDADNDAEDRADYGEDY